MIGEHPLQIGRTVVARAVLKLDQGAEPAIRLDVFDASRQVSVSFEASCTAAHAGRTRTVETALQGARVNVRVFSGFTVAIEIRRVSASHLPGRTGMERAMHLLERTRLATVPGDAFHTGGRGHDMLRFCFGKTDADLDEACERLREARL